MNQRNEVATNSRCGNDQVYLWRCAVDYRKKVIVAAVIGGATIAGGLAAGQARAAGVAEMESCPNTACVPGSYSCGLVFEWTCQLGAGGCNGSSKCGKK